MIITISGYPGSGKSTVSKYLAQRLKMKRYGMGDMRRKMALSKGMTIDDLNKLGESESWTDKEVDEYQKELAKTEDNFIVDGRLSWYFIPQSIKVYLAVEISEGAKRIFKDPRESEEKYSTVNQVEEEISTRLKSDQERYKKLYGIDPYDLENYDIIIDTTNLSVEQMNSEVEKVIKEFSN